MCATGKKGVGKTFTTMQLINSYIKPNKSTGKKARKVLIYDINMEYTDYKAISVKDVANFTRSPKIEVRRVLPMTAEGKIATLEQMIDILNHLNFLKHQ